jgi:hypothetical protein
MFAHHNDTPEILFWTKMTDFCPVAGSVILAREQKHVSHTVLNALKNTVWDAILARKYRSERVSWAYTRAGIFLGPARTRATTKVALTWFLADRYGFALGCTFGVR